MGVILVEGGRGTGRWKGRREEEGKVTIMSG
jgi:hypothetical protein